MENTPLISIIITVYNMEQYLERCLGSITGQSYSYLQIILVDDGSTDQSGRVCDAWAKKDPRIEVVHTANGGIGAAKNAGIGRAKGDYLLFIDSDDYAEPEMAELLLRTLQEHGGEVCCGGRINVLADGKRVFGKPPQKLVYSGREEMAEFLKEVLGPPPEKTYRGFAGMFCWGNLYAVSLFSDPSLRFRTDPGLLCQDLIFNLAVYKKAERVCIAPYCLYNYCANDGSATLKYRADRFAMTKKVNRIIESDLKEELAGHPELGPYVDRNYMDYLIGCMKSEVKWRRQIGKKRCLSELKQMAGDGKTQQILGRYPVRRMEGKQRILFTLIRKKRIRSVYWLFRLRYRI